MAQLSLDEREGRQCDAVRSEAAATEARCLRRVSRGTLCLDVVLSGAGGRERVGPFELLERLERVLVVAGRGAGKTALIQLLAGYVAQGWPDEPVRLPLLAPVSLLDHDRPRLDVRQLARLNPAAGEECVRRALREGRAVVLIDGLDEAVETAALKESIAVLAEAHPRCAFVVTTRPLPAKVPGVSESAIRGFSAIRFASPLLPVTPVYELQARRSPAARVRVLGAEIERRLEAWRSGAVLGRMSDADRLTVAVGIASVFHRARALECPVARIARRLPSEIPTLRWSDDDHRFFVAAVKDDGDDDEPDSEPLAARQIDAAVPDLLPLVEDVRACGGLLIEERPGVLAFADLAFQEYLAAVGGTNEERATEVATYEFLERRTDPWWHEVIVCAAGLSPSLATKLPPVALVRRLLEEDQAAGSATTFLAARMIDVVPELPRELRDTIERRLRETIPPRSSVQVWHLVSDVGDIAAHALIRAVDSAGPDERAYIATTLGRLDHAPALRVLARLAEDPEPTTEPILCWAWNVDAVAHRCPVAFFAFTALFNLAISNPAARPFFDDVLARVPREVFEAFFRVLAQKFASDDYWGNDPPPERDPDRVADMLDSVHQAAARRAPVR